MTQPLPIAKSSHELYLLPGFANRHGLITGATGTGKTVTLQTMAEAFSSIGVPVFMADVKGDLAGLSQAGAMNPKLKERIDKLALGDFAFSGCPTVFWDVYGALGHPVRATVSEMGPLLLARLLNLNETQSGVLTLVFKIADDKGLLLLDLKDLRAMVQHVGDNARQFTTEYGNISSASIGAIQRGLLAIDEQGGDHFFGEPALNIADLMQTDDKGRGVINILAADKLMNAPKAYSTLLLWLLSELFEELPEVGDPKNPSWCSSSTKRTCCSTMRRRRCWKNRTGRQADPLQGRGRLFRDAEPAGCSGHGARPTRQPRAACAARLYASATRRR